MNKIQIGGYIRISKKEAARRYNAGEVIRLTACKLSPVSPCGCYSDVQRESYTQVSGDGFNTTIARNREFETVVNMFTYYNCTNETGRYPAYWKKERSIKEAPHGGGVFLYKEVYIMKFEQKPKRCYLCCKAFSQAVKPIPVIGGICTPGYICPTCYNKLFRRDKQE